MFPHAVKTNKFFSIHAVYGNGRPQRSVLWPYYNNKMYELADVGIGPTDYVQSCTMQATAALISNCVRA